MAFDEKANRLHKMISECAEECREEGNIKEAEAYEATLETIESIWNL